MEDQTEKNTGWRLQDYIDALEEERKKIEVFHRELPLTMQIVTQAIENCRQQMEGASFFPSRSDLEGTSSDGPVLEEFIPVRPSSSSEEEKSKETTKEATKNPDWLRSVQLWNKEASLPSEEDPQPTSPPSVEITKSGAFHLFHRETPSAPAPAPAPVASSTPEVRNSKGDEKTEPSHRKPRRCWSSELHRLFLDALQQLGGSHVATPKQIKELMNVDGLTNDEVKSHLQKYRLHTRRPALSIHNNSSSSSSSPQFVVVGGIWVPPPEYAAAMMTGSKETTDAPTNKIYAPIATLPKNVHSQHQHDGRSPTGPLHSEGWTSPEHDHPNPISPTTSSS
ncbi:transcription factor NIGT1-like [Magnolia sinica]|uniref:transcription factor NIGT1-like n=1 Tax=Magnolia sinica TaxID=86752 RepID=UPI00265A5559|nr:transcription factor NIGT1-like [Magnolia sinica]